MNAIYIIIIFIVVCISYFHIVNQYRTSEDLVVYEMDYKDNVDLQETCNINQPVIFQMGTIEFPDLTTYKQILNVKDNNLKNSEISPASWFCCT